MFDLLIDVLNRRWLACSIPSTSISISPPQKNGTDQNKTQFHNFFSFFFHVFKIVSIASLLVSPFFCLSSSSHPVYYFFLLFLLPPEEDGPAGSSRTP